jgi:ABC-type dipeptide/oligopeptide/nickel transport system permease component
VVGYIVRRFIRMAIVLWVVTFFLFLFMRWLPGDIAAVRLGDMATPERLAAARTGHRQAAHDPVLGLVQRHLPR